MELAHRLMKREEMASEKKVNMGIDNTTVLKIAECYTIRIPRDPKVHQQENTNIKQIATTQQNLSGMLTRMESETK